MPLQNKHINTEIGGLIPIQQLARGDEKREFFWWCYNHPANNIFMYWSTRPREAFDEIFENIISKGSKEVFVYCEKDSNDNNILVGTCRIIIGTGPYAHIATCASATINPEFKRNGAGTRLKKAVQEYVKKHYPHIVRHELTYELDNPASRRIENKPNYYEKCGYIPEGNFEDYWPRTEINYAEFKNNPYKKYLDENDGDKRMDKHFWFTTEVYAGYLTEDLANYEKSKITSDHVLRVFPHSKTEESSSYVFRLAEKKDIAQLCELYKNSYSAWNDIFTTRDELKQILGNHITQKKLFIVEDKLTNSIAASAITTKHNCITHTIALQNVTAVNSDAANILFNNIVKNSLKIDPNIKRVELNIVAEDQVLVKALEQNGFEHCGIERAKYFDKKQQKYFDEFMFDCKLFRISDALNCCEKRLAAETKLKGNAPFNMMLGDEFLSTMKSILNDLMRKISEDKLSLEQEVIAYRIIRTVCTQDYISVSDRRLAIRALNKTFSDYITSEPDMNKLFDHCDKYLTMKLNNQLSSYPDRSGFLQSAPSANYDEKQNNSTKENPVNLQM